MGRKKVSRYWAAKTIRKNTWKGIRLERKNTDKFLLPTNINIKCYVHIMRYVTPSSTCMNTYVHGKCQKLCTRHLILPNQFGPKNHHPHRCMVSVCQSILTSLVTGANHVTATAMVIAPCERWSSTRDALLLGHDLWSNCIAFLPWTVIWLKLLSLWLMEMATQCMGSTYLWDLWYIYIYIT